MVRLQTEFIPKPDVMWSAFNAALSRTSDMNSFLFFDESLQPRGHKEEEEKKRRTEGGSGADNKTEEEETMWLQAVIKVSVGEEEEVEKLRRRRKRRRNRPPAITLSLLFSGQTGRYSDSLSPLEAQSGITRQDKLGLAAGQLTTSEPISSSTFPPPLPLGCFLPSERQKQTQNGCQKANPGLPPTQMLRLTRSSMSSHACFDMFEEGKKWKTVFRQKSQRAANGRPADRSIKYLTGRCACFASG
ncbi:hypothetical protein PAMP_024079 [Pampus punctatissimus]